MSIELGWRPTRSSTANHSCRRPIETAGDRGIYTAPAISPDGTDVDVVYNVFTTPFRNDTTSPRVLVGVVIRADSSSNPGHDDRRVSWSPTWRPGDPRA
jgi:hypothetical protein